MTEANKEGIHIVEALYNLNLASTSDKVMMEELIPINHKITEANENLTAQIKVLTETNVKVVGKLGHPWGGRS